MVNTKDISRQVPASSSSGPIEVSARCEATLDLGRKLTRELELDQSVDTLGRWMAHYIAELMQNAENASPEERPEGMRACCDAILNLWKHHHTIPYGKHPFEDTESILRAIASLDPQNETPRYFREARTSVKDDEESDETKNWLRLIEGIDYSARILIRYSLTRAAETSLNKSAEWIALADAADAEESFEFPLIRMIVEEDRLLDEPDLSEEEKKLIKDRIDRLEGFAELALAVASELRREAQQDHNDREES